MPINKLGVLKYGDEKEPLAMEMCCHLTTIACINLESIHEKESMRSAVRLPMAYSRDLNLGLTQSSHGVSKWRGVHSNGRAVVKDLTRSIH